MNKKEMSQDDFLVQSKMRIENGIKDSKIASKIATRGYTPEKMSEGKLLYEEASDMAEKQKAEYGELEGAYKKRDVEKWKAEEDFRDHRKLAKIGLKNDIAGLVTLGLTGVRPQSFSGWERETRNFYNNISNNQEWLDAMAHKGVTVEELDASKQKVAEVSTLNEVVRQEMGDAQNATVLRDAKLDELNEWINDFEEVAKIALKDQPQLLEKLGIIVK